MNTPKKFIFLFIAFALTNSLGMGADLNNAISKLSQRLTKEYNSKNKRTLAIVPFTEIDGEQTKLGRLLSEKLITAVHKTKKFKIVERTQIEKVLEELKLGTTGLLDESTAKKVGKMVGAELIISGNYTQLAKKVDLNSRLIATDTGEVQSSANVLLRIDKDLSSLLRVQSQGQQQDQNIETTSEPVDTPPSAIKNYSGPPQNVEGGIYFSYFDPEATAVYLAGDFNDWADAKVENDRWVVDNPKWLMTKQDNGTWEFTLPVPSAGLYLYKFVVNNSEWRIDPNAYEFVQGYPGNAEDNSIYSALTVKENGSMVVPKQ